MTAKQAFFNFLSPGHLYGAAIFFGIITVCIVIMIYAYLSAKKRRWRIKTLITARLNEWMSDLLMEDEIADVVLPTEITKYFEKEVIRQFVIDSLIDIKNNVTGNASVSVVKLYEALGLRQDSVEKMKSIIWHKKARGIYELYMMQQSFALEDIAKHTSSSNEYVRTEAQTATVGFAGFAGLQFLNTLEYPINEWQQLKILEQLDKVDAGEMPDIANWLRSPNSYVVHFALKLADIYQQFHVHDEIVACLASDSEKIRGQAIKALGRIASTNTTAVLREQYTKETYNNKLEILRQIGTNGTSDDLKFLEAVLEDPDDSLNIEAGKAILSVQQNWWNVLENKAAANSKMASILRHIKHGNTP